MDDLHCNRLTCRKVLVDKAVVTTCSHIFCVECANEIFATATLVCAACETILDQPDDVVVCSLHPTNDYKTSILSGLTPGIILEICNRAISFWQYQVHQEGSFQQAVLRNVNERNAQMQKQLENVVREANSELGLLNNKVAGLERDLELERRKNRDLVEASKEKDVEYQKLKGQLDKMKRKALLAPNSLSAAAATASGPNEANGTFGHQRLGSNRSDEGHSSNNHSRMRPNMNTMGANGGRNTNPLPTGGMTGVVMGMDANKIQRTPIRQGFNAVGGSGQWQPQLQNQTLQIPQQLAPQATSVNRSSRQLHQQRHRVEDFGNNNISSNAFSNNSFARPTHENPNQTDQRMYGPMSESGSGDGHSDSSSTNRQQRHFQQQQLQQQQLQQQQQQQISRPPNGLFNAPGPSLGNQISSGTHQVSSGGKRGARLDLPTFAVHPAHDAAVQVFAQTPARRTGSAGFRPATFAR